VLRTQRNSSLTLGVENISVLKLGPDSDSGIRISDFIPGFSRPVLPSCSGIGALRRLPHSGHVKRGTWNLERETRGSKTSALTRTLSPLDR